MLRKAGRTAGPNGLTLFVDIHGWPGVVKKNFFFKNFFLSIFIFPRVTPGSSASLLYY